MVAFVATCGGEPELVAPPAIPAPAIVELPVLPPVAQHVAVAPAPSITARVLHDGEPVADALVSISDGGKPLLTTAHTDRDGIAHFADLEPGAYELWAAHDSTASAIARVMDVTPESKVDIILDRPAAVLHGHLEADGELPTDATIQLVPMDLDHAIRVASADPRGGFDFTALPYGRWRVEVTASGHVQTAEQSVVIGASPDELVVRLQRTAVMSGIVVDPMGAPVANATIVLRDQAGTTMEQPIHLAASRLRWVHPLAGARVVPSNDSTVFGAPRSGSRPAECGRGHCGIDLVQPRGSIIHAVADGQIAALFPDSKTEAGRVVVVHHGGGLKSFYMHLDEIRPGLEVGQWVHAGDPVGTLGSTGFTHSVPHLHFALTHETGGRTWYLDPEPMIRTAVVLPAPRPFDPVDGNVQVASKTDLAAPVVATITTDAKGAFRIESVAPGSYVAAAFAQDFAPGVSAPFNIRSGDEITGIVIRVTEGVLVMGRVTGRDGPIPGATVIASAGMGESAHKIATTTTDKYGEYALRSIGGKITLGVSAIGYGDAERAITIVEGRDHQREDYTLTIEDGLLRGVVLAPDGGAAAGISVRVVEGTTRRRTVSDAYGRFMIAPVATGRYVVELSSLDYPPKRVSLDTTNWAELRLDAGGGARALIRDSHSGAALANIRVDATGPGGQASSRTSDARGFVELRGLAAGDWSLAVRAPGYLPTTKSVTVRVGRGPGDTVVDLVRGATLAGEVRDHFGRRVAGARVTLGSVSTTTDADGVFRLTGVESGTLEAEADGGHASIELRLAPGEERLSLTVNLDE
ncbi:MAG TPA: carboxypeptidase regulatory-like domain-containing protein [Kofleriaceae bacterium]|nr:carboxypeptidase regulatory-like domain-containing protein [Kofleriaceae bacterium]